MAGRIPPHFIDELLGRVDIVDVIEPRVRLKKAGRDYQGLCPFHNEKSPSFTVSQTKQFYHCFGCGAHGTAIGFLMEHDRMGFREAVDDLAQSVGLQVPVEEGDQPARPADEDNLFEVMEKAADSFRHALRHHAGKARAVEYLKGRGLTGEIAAAFGLGFAPPGWDYLIQALSHLHNAQRRMEKVGLIKRKEESNDFYDRFRDRIIFPIRDRRGRVVGFGGRVLGDEKPKYLNSPETPIYHKGRELYGLFEAREALRKPGRLLVVEGYMDVVALAQFGVRYAVAALGTACTPQQLELAFKLTPEVVFCFDGDQAGRTAAERALNNALPVLRQGRQVRFLFLPEGEDPDTLIRKEGREAFERRVAGAEPLSDFLFNLLTRQVDMSSMDGRARLLELARPMVGQIPPGIYRDLLLDRLAELSRTKSDYVRDLVMDKPTATPVERPVPKVKYSGWSLVRKAVAMLLHLPGLAQRVPTTEGWQTLELKGIGFLVAFIGVCRAQPQITTGRLLERWRDTPEGRSLDDLADWRMPFEEEQATAEFDDLVERLNEEARMQRYKLLTSKGLKELTDEEKAEIQAFGQRKPVKK